MNIASLYRILRPGRLLLAGLVHSVPISTVLTPAFSILAVRVVFSKIALLKSGTGFTEQDLHGLRIAKQMVSGLCYLLLLLGLGMALAETFHQPLHRSFAGILPGL